MKTLSKLGTDKEKCVGTGCPMKQTCLRYTAEDKKPAQDYLAGIPYDHGKKTCDYYITNILR